MAQSFFDWYMNAPKAKEISQVVKRLFSTFGERNFRLVDYWDADLCAVGIRNSTDGEYLIYISTFRSKKDHYFVEVEDSEAEYVLNHNANEQLRQVNF